ncbi:MAG: TerB family tellurite resistance protein [Pseudomonadota bacterium]
MSIWSEIGRLAKEAAREAKRPFAALFDAFAERRAERDAALFSVALIALSAKMAKADGIVTDDEVAAFGDFFGAPAEEMDKVRALYGLAQEDVAGFDHYARRVARIYAEEPTVLEDVLDCLFHVAGADGVAHPEELRLLKQASDIFGIKEGCWRRIKAAHFGVDPEDAFAILGVEPDASDEEISAARRDLAKRHHPDALAARGVPLEALKIAEGRMAAVNAAYEKIMSDRRAA